MVLHRFPIACFLVLTSVARAGEPSTDWGPVMSGLQMSVHLEKSKYRADEPIMAEVAIKNTSNEVVSLGMSVDELASFEIVVSLIQSEAGGLGRMPLTKFGVRRITPFDAKKNIEIRLKPGEQRSYRFPVNRMYDMTLDGNYTLLVNRLVPGGSRYDTAGRLEAIEGRRRAVLVSNELKLVLSTEDSKL